MAGFVRNLLREARLALNYQGWRIREPVSDEPVYSDDDGPNFLSPGSAPTPIVFGDEEFGAFCVQGGFVFRLDTSLADELGQASPDQFGGGDAERGDDIVGVVKVSALSDVYEELATYNIVSYDSTFIVRDEGILATDLYVYVAVHMSNGRQIIWQINKGTHDVREVWNGTGSINDTGMLYDFDNGKVYIIQALTQTISGIHELDEDAGTISRVLSAGGGSVNMIVERPTTTQTGKVVGGVWYAKDGIAWNSWLVSSTATPNLHRWLGIAGWRWGDLEAFVANGTNGTQTIDLVRGSGTPEVDVGRDIGWRYGDTDTPDIDFWRCFQFCLDEGGVGWFSYLWSDITDDAEIGGLRNRRSGNLNANVGFSGVLESRLARYDFTGSQPALISAEVYRWGEPGGYNFRYVRPSSVPSTQQDIGSVVCMRQEGDSFVAFSGEYSVVGLPDDVGISFEDLGTSGRFYVEPADYDDLEGAFGTGGIYDVEVQYIDSEGSSQIQVRLVVLISGAGGELPAPLFVGAPYRPDILVGTSERTRIVQVAAVGADSYRFRVGGNPQNLFDISAVSGEIFWAGTRAVADTDTTFNLVVEAVAEGATTAEDVSSLQAVVVSVVSEEDGEPYVAPSWNTGWRPIGYNRVGSELRNTNTFTDGYYKTIDLTGGIVAGSVPLDQFRYDVVVGDTSIGDAVWYEGSPIISFVGLGSGTTTFSVRVSDGQGAELALVVFRISWALPALTATSLRWVQGAGQALATTSISIPVMEGSTRREVLTSGADQLYIDVGARRRDLNVFVEDGADVVSVVLGGEATWDISGTTHYFRRVRVFTSGTNLDYETATTRSVRLSASTSQEHLSDVDYAAATSDLPVTINVGDLPLDTAEPFVEYVPFQVNPGWRPLPVAPTDWEQFGAHTWLRNGVTGGVSYSVDLSQSVIAGTRPVSFSFNVLRSDLGRAVLSGDELIMNGVLPGSVTYQVSASDGTTTRRVVDLNIAYVGLPTSQTEIRLLQGSATLPTGLAISVGEGAPDTEYLPGEFSVVMFGYNNRNIRLSTDLGTALRAELGTEDITEGGRTGKRLHLFTSGLLVSDGQVLSGTLTASVDETTINGVRWSASSVSVPVTITGTAAATQPTRFRFFGGQDRTELNAVVFDTITENQAEAPATFGHGGALYVWCSQIEAPRVVSVASDRANVRAVIDSPGVDLGFHFDGQTNQVIRVHRVRVFVSGAGEITPDLHPGTLTFSVEAVNISGTEWAAGSRGLSFSGSVLPDFG